jgi:hypothetical protein
MHQKRHSSVLLAVVFTILVAGSASAAPHRKDAGPLNRIFEAARRFVVRTLSGGDISIPKP